MVKKYSLMRYFLAWLLAAALLPAAAQAQGVAYGDWQLHLPARRPLMLADAGSRLYLADEQATFSFFDKASNATQLLSRRDGLSDVGVAALAYDSVTAQLVVAYRNGNLDIIGAGGKVRNVTDILRKDSQTAKTVNQIQVYGGLAYLSSTLGVVVLDLARLEVRDTYSAIGPGGASVTAYATAVLNDTIFVASSRGLLRGRIDPAINLLDYRSWTTELPAPDHPETVFTQAVVQQGHLYVGSSFRGVDYLAGTGATRAWRPVDGSYGTGLRRLRSSAVGLLLLFDEAGLRRVVPGTATVAQVLPVAALGVATDFVRERDGTYFVAGYNQGLLRFAPGNTSMPEVIRPNAPASTLDFGLLADAASNTVDVLTGGYLDNTTGQGRHEGFYEYKSGQWTNYTPVDFPNAGDIPNVVDISHAARTADGTLYLASYGNGLVQWQGVGMFKQYTATNSPLLSTVEPGDPFYLGAVRVPDVAVGEGGTGPVWVVNFHQRPNQSGLLRFDPTKPNNPWQTTPYFTLSERLNRVAVDGYGNPWATTTRKDGGLGLVAYDTTSHQAFYFTTADTLPSNVLYSIARDRAGAMWVGTDKGVAVFSDPSRIIAAAQQNSRPGPFVQPIVRRGTGTGFEALYNERVTSIAIDGANRKWFGTGNGLWLFNADATEALLHFTTDNSPLPSNSIVDVAVNDKTGDVFVATDGGVVSYRGSATITDGKVSCAQVSPNPVRPEFVGTVGISGVVDNAEVKITDLAGHLVYSTRASGGTVTWNLADVAGRRVHSGVYLVLTSDAQGKNTCVSKVAVVSNER